MRSKLLKYGLVGLLGALLHIVALIVLVEAAGLAPVPSSIAGFLLTVVAQYGLNRKWTFRSNARRTTEFLRYAAVSVFGLGLNALVMHICTDLLSLHYLIAQVLAMIVIPLSNYGLNRVWTFRPSMVDRASGRHADRNG